MTVTVKFSITLESEYAIADGRLFGLVGKKSSHLVTVDGTTFTTSSVVGNLDGLDYLGDAIFGKKNERFVYFGLMHDGKWLRRWKLRHIQLDQIFAKADADCISVSVSLGRAVTPVITFTS